jgi:O-acetyl-ADP-ribose deacetylase (regulator of RNase III)
MTIVHFNIVKTIVEHGIQSLAIPAISTGIYRYPVKEAARIAIDTLSQFMKHFKVDLRCEMVLNDKGGIKSFRTLYRYALGSALLLKE